MSGRQPQKQKSEPFPLISNIMHTKTDLKKLRIFQANLRPRLLLTVSENERILKYAYTSVLLWMKKWSRARKLHSYAQEHRKHMTICWDRRREIMDARLRFTWYLKTTYSNYQYIQQFNLHAYVTDKGPSSTLKNCEKFVFSRPPAYKKARWHVHVRKLDKTTALWSYALLLYSSL